MNGFFLKPSKDIRSSFDSHKKKQFLNMKKDIQFCFKIATKYLPSGLKAYIPKDLMKFCRDIQIDQFIEQPALMEPGLRMKFIQTESYQGF